MTGIVSRTSRAGCGESRSWRRSSNPASENRDLPRKGRLLRDSPPLGRLLRSSSGGFSGKQGWLSWAPTGLCLPKCSSMATLTHSFGGRRALQGENPLPVAGLEWLAYEGMACSGREAAKFY